MVTWNRFCSVYTNNIHTEIISEVECRTHTDLNHGIAKHLATNLLDSV